MSQACLQTAVPKTAADVHSESEVGMAMTRANNQIVSLKVALETLHTRLNPILVSLPGTGAGGGANLTNASVTAPSQLSSDINILYQQLSSCTDHVHELISALTI